MNETLRTLKSRRSIRQFKPEQIQETELNAILDAALYAPSAMNGQPWHLTVIQNAELLDAINADAKAGAAQSDNEYFRNYGTNAAMHFLYKAPTAIVISASEASPYATSDCAALAQNLLVAAESLDIGSCWIGLTNFALKGEKAAHYREKLAIPTGYAPCYTVILGYKKSGTPNAPERKADSVNFVR